MRTLPRHMLAPRATSAPIILALLLAAGVLELPAQGAARAPAPTFTRDVAPILYRNCTGCHHQGGIAPMPLVKYEDAKEYAPDIVDAVMSGFMPPWHADAPPGTFRNERRLTDAEKDILVRWFDANVPNGDPKDLPPEPRYAAGWSIGTPDAVVTMPADYEVPATGTIEYQYFEVPTNLTEDRWVQAIEILPGARDVVHHVLVFARAPAPPAPPPGTPRTPPVLVRRPDHAIPPPPPGPDGRPRELGALIASTAPGTNAIVFPEGAAMRVRAGTVLTFQMHYTTMGHAMKDRTSLGMIFAKAPPAEEIRATSFQNGQFTIPAGAADHQVPAELGFRQNVRVWGLLPHTHLRGKRWEYRLVHPDGRSELILSVPKYDFNWQTYYLFAKPLEIPAGARLESLAWYDNSANNPANPDPTKDVKWGDQTWEEMQYTGILYSVVGSGPRPGGSPP